ncbi:MAG TPA: D-alanyl-D-alanine endopeptidase [Steroidobacteraceae bacterium]|nr:D-alanyl-D-alanine endopeptidase [Steroidobacteraceae bacterium]
MKSRLRTMYMQWLAAALTVVMLPAHAHATHPNSAKTEGPGVRSSSALVLDEQSDEVLYSRQADVASPIASISKLMTALVVLEANQPMDEELQITEDDLDYEKHTTSRLKVGTRLTRDDLLHLALMSSENRAAHTLARNYPGGIVECVRAMNFKARELGMMHTHFVEPTGLSRHNVASPEDLSRLVMAAAKNNVIREYSTDEYLTLRIGRQMMTFRNTDLLVRKSDWNIIVQKTGYIAEAGKCLVLNTIIEGRSVIIVLLDSVGKYTRIADARRIRKWMEAKLRTSMKLADSSSALTRAQAGLTGFAAQ